MQSSSIKPPLCPGCSEVVDPSGEHGKKPGLISNIAHPHDPVNCAHDPAHGNPDSFHFHDAAHTHNL